MLVFPWPQFSFPMQILETGKHGATLDAHVQHAQSAASASIFEKKKAYLRAVTMATEAV